MCERHRWLGLLACAVALLASPAAAQEADSLAAPLLPPADTLVVPADTFALPADTLVVPADSLAADSLALAQDSLAAAPPRRAVGFAQPEAGRVVTAIPTRRPVFTAADLLGALPGAFHYDLGVPGWPDGVAFGGLGPSQASLTLDGLPAHDVFSGRPAWELLPLDILAPLRLRPRYGEAAGVDASVRAFAAPVPITELRFRTGRSGIQFISATHAQTRRPQWVRRLGGDRARLQALAHVSGRAADGEYANFDVRGWQLLARVGIALPAFSLEVTERHGRDKAGAASVVPSNPFATVFDRDNATVDDVSAERETVRNDLAATLRLPVLDAPLTATLFWTAETFHYIDPLTLSEALDDTLTVRGDRVGLRLVQPLALGRHRLAAQATAWLDRIDAGLAISEAEDESSLHVALLDSLALGGFDLVLEAGLHAAAGQTFPTLGVAATQTIGSTRLFAEVRQTGAGASRFERSGFGEVLAAQASRSERTLLGALGLDAELGPFDLGLSVRALQQTDPRLLVTTDSVATFVTGEGAFRRVTGTLTAGWRDRARRGFYIRTTANASTFLNEDTELHARAAEALPPLWGDARFGFRALGLFDDNLDLDLAVRGRGWVAFRGRTLHAPTALYALPAVTARPNDASGTLDFVAEAGIGGGRATVFVVYQNFLASRAYDGAVVVPVYPLTNPLLRFGVFWLLPN